MDNTTQETSSMSPIKRILALITLVVMIICGIRAVRFIYKTESPAGYYDIDAENAEIDTFTSESKVYYKPVCPACEHIHDSYRINMSAGEEYENIYFCEYCGEMFYVTIKKGK